MRVTNVKKIDNTNEMKKDYDLAIEVWVNKKQKDKLGIVISPDIDGSISMLCCQRLNRVMAQMMNISYPTFLKMLEKCYLFDERTKNLDLSEEQLQKMIDKDIRG